MATGPASPTVAEATFAPFRTAWRIAMVLLLLWVLSVASNIAWVRYNQLDPVEHMSELIDFHVDRGGQLSDTLAMSVARWSIERLDGVAPQPPQGGTADWDRADTGSTIHRSSGGLSASLTKAIGVTFRPDLTVAAYGVVLFAAKLGILVAIMSAAAVLLLVAGVDGLVQRSIRKACGGVESAALYHRAKLYAFRLVPPAAGLIYFCNPLALDPAWIFVPTLALSALLLRVQATFYKKHL